ncbi:major facilitator superfamily domain-containing protein [Rhodocollybia butyracea]|uniref:Major facilitator superfamily domain-containing protein n=1 Tax=Rhodocollybia butyracea TaxID=206335 RepID=A0A9P5UGP4_9AGAR|nr:major facilitator superfamily domain-containing protein [Rhodocollybia butyracea]
MVKTQTKEKGAWWTLYNRWVIKLLKEIHNQQTILRKIDWRLLPIMFITYNFNFIDKSILSSAAVFGLENDTHLVGQQYSWVSSIFYFGYLGWTYPTTIFIQKLPVGRYVSINTIIWGIIVACTALCTNFGSLLTVRFLLGVAEATITPSFVYITSMWYTREEIPFRTGTWFAGNSFGGFMASLLAYVIGRIESSISLWRWLFIIFGFTTMSWGILLLFILPSTVESSRFLNEEEKKHVLDSVARSGTGKTTRSTSAWKFEQVIECLIDPKTWFFFGISICTQIPNSGTQNFANLVLQGLGFTSLQTTLVGIPSSFIAFFTILITGWLAGKYHEISCYLIALVVVAPVAGSALIYSTKASNGVKLFAYYLLATGPGALPLAMSLMTNNYKGVTKKMTVTAFLFLAYCTGNIAGPQTFKTLEAPIYPTAFRAIMICYTLVVVEALGLRIYLSWMNKKLRMRLADSGPPVPVMNTDGMNEDMTDWQSYDMVYWL